MRNIIIAILLLVSSCLYAQNKPTFEQVLQAAKMEIQARMAG